MSLQTLPLPATHPPRSLRWNRWRKGLFGSPLNIAVTVAVLGLFAWAVPPLIRWTLLDATWSGTPEDCAQRSGACWAFIGVKLRFITFGFYPPPVQWRSFTALILLGGLVIASAIPRFWRPPLLIAWIAVPAAAIVLLSGLFSGGHVSTEQWGGLTLTLLVSVTGFAGAFPIAVLLALGRRSRLGGIRLLCVAFIETVRGVPLVAVLYVATLLVPMMLPEGITLDKLLRAQIGIIVFISAYLAEIVRAGLQALPSGQTEAAASLGLTAWQTQRLVTLPQALKAVIPAIVNLLIGLVQNTPLVAVIGIFDLLNAARKATDDTAWLGFYNEAYVFSALVYFALCFTASRYSLWLERWVKRSDRH